LNVSSGRLVVKIKTFFLCNFEKFLFSAKHYFFN